MFASHRSCVLIVVILAVTGIPGCNVFFWLDPAMECPASMNVGEESTLVIHHPTDAIMWRQQSDEDAGGVFVRYEYDMEGEEMRTGDPFDTGITDVVFRAERAGIITITAEEVFIGTPILPIPYRLSTVQCTFAIVDE